MSRDPEDGESTDPKTLHKYLYAGGDPINRFDPSGRAELEGYALQLTRVGAALVAVGVCTHFAIEAYDYIANALEHPRATFSTKDFLGFIASDVECVGSILLFAALL
jgi:hypothetical protein